MGPGAPQPASIAAFGSVLWRPRVPLLFGSEVMQRIRRTARLQRIADVLLVCALPAVLAQVVVAVAVALRQVGPAPVGLLPTYIAFALLAANRVAAGRAARLRPQQYPVAHRDAVAVAGLDAEAARQWADRNPGLGVTVREPA